MVIIVIIISKNGIYKLDYLTLCKCFNVWRLFNEFFGIQVHSPVASIYHNQLVRNHFRARQTRLANTSYIIINYSQLTNQPALHVIIIVLLTVIVRVKRMKGGGKLKILV